MKIAFIPSTFLPHIGGAEIQAHNVANKLVERGHDVEIFVLDKVEIKNAKYKIISFKKKLINLVYLFRYYLNVDLNFILRAYFKSIIKEKKIDAWHFQSVNFKTLIYIEVLRSLNQKIIVTLQGADIQINKEIGYGYRLDKKYDQLIHNVFQKVDIFHAISNDIKSELINFGIDKNKIFKITNFSVQKKFDNISKKNNQILTLLTVGRFAIKKKVSI
ncbi:glycosyltransferase [Candidatus Pelagibacter sp. Uisw_092]|uniref:glycosyltransferase n=1 Tax=Candidatus Pelagibacter sp. Uisw_092 TaxID=3230979 RepID=UPI0039EA5756